MNQVALNINIGVTAKMFLAVHIQLLSVNECVL